MKQKLIALALCLLTALLFTLPAGAEEPQTEEERQALYQQEQAKWDEACQQEDERYHRPVDMEAAQRDIERARQAVEKYGCDPEYVTPYCRLFSKKSTDLTFDQIYSSTGGYITFKLDREGNPVGQTLFGRGTEEQGIFPTMGDLWFDEALYDLLCRYPDKKSIFLIDKGARYLMVQVEEGNELIYPLPVGEEYQGEYKSGANARSGGPIDADWQTFLNATVYRNENDPVVGFGGAMGGFGGKITDYLGQKPALKINWTALWIGGCTVLLLAAVGAVLLVRRRKKTAEQKRTRK